MNNNILILLLLSSLAIYATNKKKIIVALSLNDCISCSIALTEVNNILKNPEMTIVFEEELMTDSILVKKKTGLDNFKSAVPIYSDSLFKEYVNGIKSTISIVEDNQKLYSSNLYQLNVNEFLDAYLNNENTCFKNVKPGTAFIQDSKSMLVWNYKLGRWSYYDEENRFDIVADTSWVIKAYNIYFKNNESDKKYREYVKYVEEYPAINPIIRKGKKINNNELLFITTVHFIENDSNTITFIPNNFLVTYNIQKQEISSIKFINAKSLSNANYFINSSNFDIIENGFLIPLMKDDYSIDTENKYLAIFRPNSDNKNELIINKIINNNIPNNYIKYKLYQNFNGYRFDKSLVLLEYGEYIYDYEKNIEYKIPLPETEFDKILNIYGNSNTDGTTVYTVHDIADKGASILFLYNDSSNNLKLMEIDKTTQKAIKDDILIKSENSTIDSWFSINEDFEIFYFNKKTQCIEKIIY